MRAFTGEFYGKDYFTEGTKSNYKPYGPGEWADWLTEMIVEHLNPKSVLDVGCAYGFVVHRLWQRGVIAMGFDISPYAIEHKVTDSVWVGNAADPSAYGRCNVDLVIATEMPEHLTPTQSYEFLENASHHGDQILLLAVLGDHPDGHVDEGDASHINIKPLSWWVEQAAAVGLTYQPEAAALFNDDARSVRMNWAGRFMVFAG